MQSQNISRIFRNDVRNDVDSDAARIRRRRRIQSRQPAAAADVQMSIQPSPLHSVEALAAALFVATMAASWIAVASMATAPLVAAGEVLARLADR